VTVVLNEPGDLNWAFRGDDGLRDIVPRAPCLVIGPSLSPEAREREDAKNHPVWKYGGHAVVPSEWVRQFVCHGMPYAHPDLRGARRLSVWPAGVDTDFFSPSPLVTKTQDFFIYYKSQRHADLHRIHTLLFTSYFHLRGSVLAYYCYTPEMLRDVARASRFCIVLDKTETQGLALLEIMACDCPLFVIDWTTHEGMPGASSCPCWSDGCGVKTSWNTLDAEFAAFLPAVASYKPRAFVEATYSYRAAAASLLRLCQA